MTDERLEAACAAYNVALGEYQQAVGGVGMIAFREAAVETRWQELIAAARAQEPSAVEVEAAGGQLFTDIAKSTGFTDYSMHDCYVLARAALRAAREAGAQGVGS